MTTTPTEQAIEDAIEFVKYPNNRKKLEAVVVLTQLTQALSALRNNTAGESKESGMVLVPREPTEEMISAGWYHEAFSVKPHQAIAIYKAMLDAAPPAIAQPAPSETQRALTDLCRLTTHYAGGTQVTSDALEAKKFLKKHHQIVRAALQQTEGKDA